MRGYNSKFQSTESSGRNQRQFQRGRGRESYYVQASTVYQQPPPHFVGLSQSQSRPKQEDFSSILECPVCFTIPDCEIFNCDKGHSVCGNCYRRMVKCALCAAPFNGSRNFVMESLLTHFKTFGISFDGSESLSTSNGQFNCKYRLEGCKASFPNNELAKHEEWCKYRPVMCKVESGSPGPGVNKCPMDTFVKLSEYLEHLLQYHKITGLDEPSGVFTKFDRLFMGLEINSNWLPFYLKFDGKTFLRFASIRNRKLSFWVQLIGSDNECKNYRAVISLQCPTSPDTRISWSVPVFSIRCIKSIIDTNNIATISSTKILPFCSLGQQFESRVATHTWICKITLTRVDN